jgi:hypothetical protein
MINFFIIITKCFLISAQLSSYVYKMTPLEIAVINPERGYYMPTESYSQIKPYQVIDQWIISEAKRQNMTLILREFYLNAFLSSPISQDYLNGMQADFNEIRKNGIKVIVRFAYSDDVEPKDKWDTSKSQMLIHISQLRPILITNVDVIAVVQAGFIGVWGEWYFSNHFGYPFPSKTDYQNRKQILEALLEALPKSRMVQIRYPKLKNDLFNVSMSKPLSITDSYSESNLARLGYHNDCFLSNDSDWGTYVDKATEYPFMEQETKYTPMGGETCAVFKPRTLCPTALSEMQKFHYSYINMDYHQDVLAGWKTGGCYYTIQNRLGYRYSLVNAAFPISLSLRSASLTFQLRIINTGFATIFNKRIAFLVLRNIATNQEFHIPLKSDPRFWNPSELTIITESVSLPSGLSSGQYRLFLNLPDVYQSLSKRPEYSIKMANDNVWEVKTGYNSLTHIVNITN